MSSRTRQSVGCFVFGSPSELPQSQLPTESDVIKKWNLVRYQLKTDALEPTILAILHLVAEDVMKIWVRASLPILTVARVRSKIQALHENYRNSLKKFSNLEQQGQCKAQLLLDEMTKYRQESENRLFNICTCKCPDFEKCSCSKERRVPKREIDFLSDQLGPRMMMISSVDAKVFKISIKKMFYFLI